MNPSRLRFWASIVLITVIYFAAGKFGLMLAFRFPSASPVWPPTGIAIAVFLLLGFRFWPSVLIGAFLVNILTAGSFGTSITIAIGNTLEGLVGAFLIKRFAGGAKAFGQVHTVLLFIFFAAASSAISASVGSLSLLLAGSALWSRAPDLWFTWWLGDTVGALVIAPLLLLWVHNFKFRWSVRQSLEAVLLVEFMVLISFIVFSGNTQYGYAHYPLYISLLPIVWAAIRFGLRETVTTIFLLACLAILGTLSGFGPFVSSSPNTSLNLLQFYIAIASSIGMILAAALQERRYAVESLEEKVHERTKELEIALQKDRVNLERLRSIVSHLPSAALLMDEEANILELNEAYCRMFHIKRSPEQIRNMSSAELLERFLQGLLHPDEHMVKVRATIAKKEPLFDQEILLKDGRIILRDFIPTYEDGKHRGQLFLYRDVTRERRIDRSKSEFMSLASHQLRTPLTTMRWSLGRLTKDLAGKVSPTEEKFLRESLQAAARMSQTIDTMLKISRAEAQAIDLAIAEVDVCEMLRTKGQQFQPQYEAKRQTFTIDCSSPLSINTDPRFLSEILGNLLQNAITYTPETGKIFLRAWQEKDAIRIDVKDTGYGIPLDQQQNVFQKFFRGHNVIDRETSGTGLGLYLVSLLTNVLKGTVTMQSEEGKGTVFSISLPVR